MHSRNGAVGYARLPRPSGGRTEPSPPAHQASKTTETPSNNTHTHLLLLYDITGQQFEEKRHFLKLFLFLL